MKNSILVLAGIITLGSAHPIAGSQASHLYEDEALSAPSVFQRGSAAGVVVAALLSGFWVPVHASQTEQASQAGRPAAALSSMTREDFYALPEDVRKGYRAMLNQWMSDPSNDQGQQAALSVLGVIMDIQQVGAVFHTANASPSQEIRERAAAVLLGYLNDKEMHASTLTNLTYSLQSDEKHLSSEGIDVLIATEEDRILPSVRRLMENETDPIITVRLEELERRLMEANDPTQLQIRIRSEPDPTRRMQMLHKIFDLTWGPERLDFLTEVSRYDVDETMRLVASMDLLKWNDSLGREALQSIALTSANAEHVAGAMQALMGLRDSELSEVLIQGVSHMLNLGLHYKAAFEIDQLAGFGGSRIEEALLQWLTYPGDSSVRASAAQALDKSDPFRTLPVLYHRLGLETDHFPLRSIYRVIQNMGASLPLTIVYEHLRSPDSGRKRTAIQELVSRKTRTAVADILPFLKDADAEVRAQAAEALSELNDRQALSAILDALSVEGDPYAAFYLGEFIARVAGPQHARSIEVISRRYWDFGGDYIGMRPFDDALDGLKVSSDFKLQLYRAGLDHLDSKFRAMAIVKLMDLKNPAAIPILQQQLLVEQDEYSRQLLQRAVESLRGKPQAQDAPRWKYSRSPLRLAA